jgi:PAS domain S-box-containing protein
MLLAHAQVPIPPDGPSASEQTGPAQHASSQHDCSILAELAPVAVLKCTLQGRIIWANAIARSILNGYNIILENANVSDLIPLFNMNKVHAHPMTNESSTMAQTTYAITAAGHRWTGQPLPGDNGSGRDGFVLYGQPQTYYDRHSHALDHLVAVSNDTRLSFAERIESILRNAYEYFELDFGALCRYECKDVVVEAATIEHRFLFKGQRLKRDETYCSLHSDEQPVIAIHNCETEPCGSPMARARIALGAVLSVRLTVGDQVYGAMTFGHRTPRIRPFSEEEIRFLDLNARWLEYELQQQAQLEELTLREERYRTLYNKTPVMTFSVDCKGTIIEASSRFLQAIGYERERLIGRSYLDFVRIDCLPQDAATHPAPQLALEGCPDQSVDLTFVASTDQIIETELRAIRHATANGRSEILCVLSDVTAHNEAERELASTNAQLQQANDGLQRFNMIASHDLQEPLRKIRAFGSVLESELGHCLVGDAAYALSAMVNASRRLSNLVDNLLALSRESRRQYSKQPEPLARLLDETLSHASLTHDIGPMPIVACDPLAIGRIIDNFAGNSCKYAAMDRAPHLKVRAMPLAGGGYEINFADNGTGFGETDPNELFEPFKRFCEDPGVEGTGIGLAICAAIANGHDWDIGARNGREQGAEFYLRVPDRDVIVQAGEAPASSDATSHQADVLESAIEQIAPYSAA